EFALEMIIKASMHGLRVTEVPTTLRPDGRDRPSHLRSWRDGWRSLRLYLLMCPRWLFLYPGLFLTLVSGTLSFVLMYTDIRLSNIILSYHSLILTSALTSIGIQSIFFWLFARTVGVERGLLLPDPHFQKWRSILSLERSLGFGIPLCLAGFAVAGYA